jgi:hypothetical protein
MHDRPLAARLGAAARAHVSQRYSFTPMVAAFEALYLAALPAQSYAAARAEVAEV